MHDNNTPSFFLYALAHCLASCPLSFIGYNCTQPFPSKKYHSIGRYFYEGFSIPLVGVGSDKMIHTQKRLSPYTFEDHNPILLCRGIVFKFLFFPISLLLFLPRRSFFWPQAMSLVPKTKGIHKMRHRRVDMTTLPPEVIAAVVSWLGPRDHASAVLASPRFGVLTPEERGRLHFARFAPKVLARMGSLDGLCYWHGVDPWRIDIHCLRAAAGGGHRALVEWILDKSTGGGCPTEALCAAARGGHVDLMRWLIDERQAAILKEVLVDAISSKRIDAVRLILDRAHVIDHREAVESGICLDEDGAECSSQDDDHGDDRDDNDDDDGKDGSGDGDDDGDDGDDVEENARHDSCGRDWGTRPMRAAARTNDADIMQLVYDQCYYGDDPEVLGRPLSAAAESGAAVAVQWILARYADRDASADAFGAALRWTRRDCAVAILSRWPDVARPVDIYDEPFRQLGGTSIPVLDAALAVALGTQPDTWPLSVAGATAEPGQIYDALLVHCLSREFKDDHSSLATTLLGGAPCDAVFRWAVDTARCVPAVYVACDMARKGMTGRLAYCRERGLLTPVHVEVAMTGAAAAGRVDVLTYMWSSLAAGDGDTQAADAVRANVQKMADAAAESGDWTVVEWLQKHVDRRAHCTAAAFAVAANKGHAAFLKRLYAVGADRCRHPCDAPCEPVPGWSPFLFALRTPCGLYNVNDLWRNVARDGHYDVVQVLREHGALDGVYLRSEAALNGHVAICALDVAINGPCKRDLMIQYAVQARDRACLAFALANGSTWEPLGRWSIHPMCTAVKKGQPRHQGSVGQAQGADRRPPSGLRGG